MTPQRRKEIESFLKKCHRKIFPFFGLFYRPGRLSLEEQIQLEAVQKELEEDVTMLGVRLQDSLEHTAVVADGIPWRISEIVPPKDPL